MKLLEGNLPNSHQPQTDRSWTTHWKTNVAHTHLDAVTSVPATQATKPQKANTKRCAIIAPFQSVTPTNLTEDFQQALESAHENCCQAAGKSDTESNGRAPVIVKVPGPLCSEPSESQAAMHPKDWTLGSIPPTVLRPSQMPKWTCKLSVSCDWYEIPNSATNIPLHHWATLKISLQEKCTWLSKNFYRCSGIVLASWAGTRYGYFVPNSVGSHWHFNKFYKTWQFVCFFATNLQSLDSDRRGSAVMVAPPLMRWCVIGIASAQSNVLWAQRNLGQKIHDQSSSRHEHQSSSLVQTMAHVPCWRSLEDGVRYRSLLYHQNRRSHPRPKLQQIASTPWCGKARGLSNAPQNAGIL